MAFCSGGPDGQVNQSCKPLTNLAAAEIPTADCAPLVPRRKNLD
jgi:hypothetical protein